MINWTKQQARDFFVNYQMVNTSNHYTINDVFDRLKTIQMDPLNVVGTNPELVLQSRIKGFKKEDLSKALYQDRFLIDGWEKQMSIYETKYFPHFSIVRKHRSENGLIGARKYYDLDATEFIDEVYDIVKEQGPIFSSKIKLGESKKHRWGHTKPSTVAIDYLWQKGLLGISERKNTQKKYDLIQRIFPEIDQNNPFQTEEEFIEWYLIRRINTVGLTWSKSIVHFDGYYIKNRKLRNHYFDVLEKKNFIEKVHVEGIKDVFYIPLSAKNRKIELTNNISFLAPLDQITWDRELLRKLFNFDYTWEVYTPKIKRKYGYYVLPILQGSNFIGRIEFTKHRNNDPLEIISISYEEGIKQTKKLEREINRALNRFSKYLGAKEVSI
ncbi:hypothetical protein KQ51_00590 [Candidatus Izimaplasma bacterium HR1]|jgi:uncharacterized protein YcaQ|uniref:DNA glycosylase AlkZ-like family protein n=1 Tax=Candidatus Izimoplasma sp. HR1 TaxID=1541959 RepID=UPI0004F71380|nr:hypothetical protein KQ51_00590 [Candidatus Izimaplasma bacterium HR1]